MKKTLFNINQNFRIFTKNKKKEEKKLIQKEEFLKLIIFMKV